jgi:hypothetical protein
MFFPAVSGKEGGALEMVVLELPPSFTAGVSSRTIYGAQ